MLKMVGSSDSSSGVKSAPGQELQSGIVGLGIVSVRRFELGGAQRLDIAGELRGQAFENALGKGRGVLEQAVDPRVLVRVEGEGRGIHAAATRGVGDDRGRRAFAGRAAFQEVEPLFQRLDRARDALAPLGAAAVLQAGQLRLQLDDQVLRLGNVAGAAAILNAPVEAEHEPDGRHLAAAAARAVAADGGVVVLAVEHQPLGFAVLSEARR